MRWPTKILRPLCLTFVTGQKHWVRCAGLPKPCVLFVLPLSQVKSIGLNALEQAQLHDNTNQYAVAEVMYKQV